MHILRERRTLRLKGRGGGVRAAEHKAAVQNMDVGSYDTGHFRDTASRSIRPTVGPSDLPRNSWK